MFTVSGQINKTQQLVSSGDTAYRIGRYKEARDLYKQAIEEDTTVHNDQTVLLRYAMSCFRMGDYAEAKSLLSRSQAQDSSFADYIAYFTALCHRKSGTADSALYLLTVFSTNYPHSILKDEALFTAGILLHSNERYDESNRLLHTISDPSQLTEGRNAHEYYRGVNAIKLGDDSAGIRRLLIIIEQSPADSYAVKAAEIVKDIRTKKRQRMAEQEVILLARVYANNGKTSEAEKYLAEYFDQFPSGRYLGEVCYERGKLQFTQRRYADAITDFTQAVSYLKEPSLIRESRLYIARCYNNREEYARAIREYQRYAREFPADAKSAEALWTAALIYERQGDVKKAFESYQITAQKPDPNNYRERALFKVGFLWYKSDSLVQAQDYFRRLQQRNSNTDLALQAAFWEAKTLEKLGKTDEACSLYTALARRRVRNYYVITARNKISVPAAYNENGKTENVVALTTELRNAALIGLLFGEPWGNREITRFKQDSSSSETTLTALRNALLEMGIYDEAMRIADTMYARYYPETEDAEKLRWLYPKHFQGLLANIISPDMPAGEPLIYSMMRQESLFRVNAVSTAGARGLLQLIPATAGGYASAVNKRTVEIEDLFVPEINLAIGIRHLCNLIQRYNGAIPLAVAAYNAGSGAVDTWIKRYGTNDMDVFIENIEYSETKTFVKEVLKNYYYYTTLYVFK